MYPLPERNFPDPSSVCISDLEFVTPESLLEMQNVSTELEPAFQQVLQVVPLHIKV